MSEEKNTNSVTHAFATPKSKTIASETPTGLIDEQKFTPSIIPFAPKSTSAITVGKGVNLTMPVAPLVRALLKGGGYYGHAVVMTQKLIVLSNDRPTKKLLHSEFSSEVESSALEVSEPLTIGPTNYMNTEGCGLLLASIKPPRDFSIIILPAIDRKSSLARKELVPLLNAAHERCDSVIVVFQGLSTDDSACLTDYFETVLNIEACEPDAGYASAFTVAPAPGTLLAAIGKGPVIDNIRLNTSGHIERSHYVCVSPNAMNREIARCIEQGKSYTEIAEAYEVNKTTIMRRVDAMPFLRKGRGNSGQR